MSTMWTMVLQAHGGEADSAAAALAGLAQRYSSVAYRYLLGAVGDPDAAADLSQEFALRILRGAFRQADPSRGRFRDYMKKALIHLVSDYRRSQREMPAPLASEPPAPRLADDYPEFDSEWREELLDRTWKALATAQPTYQAVLLARVENPDLTSQQIADELGTRFGTAMRPDQVRKALQRAHARFADLMVDEVAASLGNPSREELTDELRELDLLKYCRSALERRSP
jgi:RNA polymerase sigma-70 factor (ECF subfamily)